MTLSMLPFAALAIESEEEEVPFEEELFEVRGELEVFDLNEVQPVGAPVAAFMGIGGYSLDMTGTDAVTVADTETLYLTFTAGVNATVPGVPFPIVKYENNNRPSWLPANAKTLTMRSDEGNCQQYIFVFHVFDTDTDTIRTTTISGLTDRQGSHLSRTYATFDDGLEGWWTKGDYVIMVDIYDLSENYQMTVFPEAFTHRSGDGVIQEDGTTESDGVFQENTGTANFWFGGLGDPPPGTSIVLEKKWIDEAGNEIISRRNNFVTIFVEKPSTDTVSFVGGVNLPGTLIVPTNAHPVIGHQEHTFYEVLPAAAPGFTIEFVRVELDGEAQAATGPEGKYVLDTATLEPGKQYTVTYVNRIIPPVPFKGAASFNKMKLMGGESFVAGADEFAFELWMYQESTGDYTLEIPSGPSDETDGLYYTDMMGVVRADNLAAGKYVFKEIISAVWELNNYEDGVFFEVIDNGDGTGRVVYAEGLKDAEGLPIVHNVPRLGALAVTVNITQQNYVQDSRNWTEQDWRRWTEQDWRKWTEQDWRRWTVQDWRNWTEQDWRNFSEQDWRNFSEQDWRNYSEQDWRNYSEQDWRNFSEQDWRNYSEQDWRKWTEQDWRKYSEQDWRNWSEQDWRNWKEQDWRNYREQDWRNVYKLDWRNIIIPVFKKDESSASGTLVTGRSGIVGDIRQLGVVPGGTFGNGFTYLKIDIDALRGAEEPMRFEIADSSPNNKNIGYHYYASVDGNDLVISFDDRLVNASILGRFHVTEPKEHDMSGIGHTTVKNGGEYRIAIPTPAPVSAASHKVNAMIEGNGNNRTLSVTINGVKFANLPWANNNTRNHTLNVGDDTFVISVTIKGNSVESFKIVSAPVPMASGSGASAPIYLFVHFSGAKWFTTGFYRFVRWDIIGTEDLTPPTLIGPENVGAPRIGTENVGAPRTGRENVGALRTGVENVGPARIGTEDVDALRSGTENVGAPRIGVENVGAPRTGVENVGQARTGVENAGDLRSGTEDVGAPRTGTENVGAPRTGVENVGQARTGVEDVGAPRTGTENVGAPRTGTENVGPGRSGAEDVGTPRTGVENVGAPRIGTEDVGAPRTGTENVGAPRTGTENVGDLRSGVEDVGALRSGTEDVGDLRSGVEDVGALRSGTEDVGALRSGVEDVGALRSGVENVGPARTDGDPVGYAGSLTLTIVGPSYNANIPVTGGSFTDIFNNLLPGSYVITLSGTDFAPMTETVIVVAGNTASESFTWKEEGSTRLNQIEARNDRIELQARNDRIELQARNDRIELQARNDRIELQARNDRIKVADRNETFKLADRNDRIQLADRNDRIQLADRNETFKLADRNDRFQLADRNEGIQLADRNDRIQLADRDDRIQLPDRNETFQLADRNETFRIADRNDRIQLPDRNETFKIADRIETFEIAARNDEIKLKDRIGGDQLADRDEAFQLKDRIIRNQIADRTACEDCNNYDAYCCEHAKRLN